MVDSPPGAVPSQEDRARSPGTRASAKAHLSKEREIQS
jgi:hypothetical protein